MIMAFIRTLLEKYNNLHKNCCVLSGLLLLLSFNLSFFYLKLLLFILFVVIACLEFCQN